MTTHVTMLASANHAGRRDARFDSRIATPANDASSRIVRNARPTIPLESPSSTQTTHTIAAAMSAPIATQMAALRSLLEFGCVIGSVMVCLSVRAACGSSPS